jgi:hypothetical protein
MSITSLINPSGEISVQDDLWHIASSDNSGQTDFKFVFDVFVNGLQLVRTKVFPDPTNGKGYFNASNVVRNEITFDWFTPVSSVQPEYLLSQPSTSGQIAQTYNIRVGEDYSGITTLNMASGNVKAYNWIPPVFKRRQQTISTFDGKYLTNRPKSAKVKLGDKLMIPFKGVVGESYVLRFRTYNAANALIATTSTSTSLSITSSNNFLQLDIGSDALNASAGATPITESVAYYDVYFVVGGTTESESFRVYLTCDNRYTPVNLHFVNAFGMFETACFNKSSRLSMDVERKGFEQRDYSFGASSVSYYDANKVYRESKINYGSKTNHSYRLTMDYPTDAEYQWLSELIVSPQIYMELDGSYYPVSIKTNNYEYSKHQNNQLRAFEIEVDVNQTRNGYRR